MGNEFYSPGEQRAAKVNELFATIAPRYDLINDLQSFGQHAAFPIAVQAKALQVVDQIVTRRDGGEQFVHLGRALFAGTVKLRSPCSTKPS